MTSDEFDKYLESEVELDEERKDRDLARLVHTVEESFHFLIDEKYDYFKFLSQVDYLQFRSKEYEKIKNQSKHGR